MPESVWVQEQLGHPVIKAFNNIYFQHLLESGLPAGAEERIALPVAGADGVRRALAEASPERPPEFRAGG